MPGATVEYDREVRPEEKALFEAKKTPFIEAFLWRSLYVTVNEDEQKRRYFRVTLSSNRSEVLAQFTGDQIDLNDTLLKTRLMGEDFRPLPQNA